VAEATTKLQHLKWAIDSRARNQKCCFRLLGLFETYSDKWQARRYSQEAQDLLAVAFSLWRAAFLADKTGKRSEVFADAREFLEKIIEDNAISYPQDRKSKEWTFNYYTRNARYALQHLHGLRSEIVPEYKVLAKRSSTERWDYCQGLLDRTVNNFEVAFAAEVSQAEERRRKRKVRAARGQRRKKVRQLTMTARKSAPAKA
jgi:hypothetical protein